MLVIVTGIIGCIEKDVSITETDQKEKNVSITETIEKIKNIEKIEDDIATETINETASKEGFDDWYKYTYTGPVDIENSENARMSIIPHLRELGWNGGIDVVEMRSNLSPATGSVHYIIITLPFQLANGSIDYINQTLANFSFKPIGLNEIVQ